MPHIADATGAVPIIGGLLSWLSKLAQYRRKTLRDHPLAYLTRHIETA
jgi:hypothetical protein